MTLKGRDSDASNQVNGTTAALLGFDDFMDGAAGLESASRTDELEWDSFDTSNTSILQVDDNAYYNGSYLRVGVAGSGNHIILTKKDITLPYSAEFSLTSQYVNTNQGVLLLYKDAENHYRVVINRDHVRLIKVFNGFESIVHESTMLSMQHLRSYARFHISISLNSSNELFFQIMKKDWYGEGIEGLDTYKTVESYTESEPAANTFFKDLALPFGFFQDQASNHKVNAYGQVYLSKGRL